MMTNEVVLPERPRRTHDRQYFDQSKRCYVDIPAPSEETLEHNEAVNAQPKHIISMLRTALRRAIRRGRVPSVVRLPRVHFASVVGRIHFVNPRDTLLGSFGPEVCGVPIEIAEDAQ